MKEQAVAEKIYEKQVFARGYKQVVIQKTLPSQLSVKSILEMVNRKIERDGRLLGPTSEHVSHI